MLFSGAYPIFNGASEFIAARLPRATACVSSMSAGRGMGRIVPPSIFAVRPPSLRLAMYLDTGASVGGSTETGSAAEPPMYLAVRPPFLKPPTCFLPSRSSLAIRWLVFASPMLPRGVRLALLLASSPSTLPPDLNARREIGRMPVFTSAFSGSAGVKVELSSLVEEAPARRRALLFIASRRLLASMVASPEVIRRPGRGAYCTRK